jgi:hypothetical protein
MELNLHVEFGAVVEHDKVTLSLNAAPTGVKLTL